MNAIAIRKPSTPQVRELSTVELDGVAGGMWQLAVGAYLWHEYYQWLKREHKI